MKKKMFYMILAINLILIIFPQWSSYAGGEDWIDWSYPKNNQGTIESERVERNPLIKIKFKYNVELIDKSKITLSSDGHIYSVDVNKDTWITYDGDMLKIDINSLYRSGKAPLRANAAYKLTIGKGALKLKKTNMEAQIDNEEISLYFITGDENHFVDKDKGLYIERYSSNENKTDDITKLSTTRLDKDGNIYIHFHSDNLFPRELKWNEWTAKKPVKSNEEALEYFKLYKVPQSYKKDYDNNGKVYDKEFRYDEYGRSLPMGGIEEIPLKSVEILKDAKGKTTNILKISPKYSLTPYNKYYIKLMERDILTDSYEKLMEGNESLLLGKGQEIWTTPLKEGDLPIWEMGKISPEQIIETQKGSKKTYTIHGAPKYNEYIDKENGKPITLYVDKEVVVNPQLNISNGVTLFEGYGEGDTSYHKSKIKWYRLEYYYENNIKKTKISIYPEGELQVGKYYELDINNGMFLSRNGKKLGEINLRFVVEGDGSLGTDRGIYKFEITNKKQIVGTYDRPFLITDFIPGKENIKFNIKGYNFAEDIKQLRFVRETDNKTIIIPSSNLKFHDVTKITGTMDNETKKEFAKITNDKECKKTYTSAGVYDIYIDFQRGNSTSTHKIEQRFIVKDRPKVIDTTPRDEENYFDPEILYEKFTNPDEEGYYIKVVFEDIGSTLKMKDSIGHGIQVNVIGDKTNLIDKNKQIVYKRELSINKYSTNRFNIYIPLIDKLDDNQKYEVYIPEDSIVEYSDIETEKNRCYKWTFSTNYFPKAEKLYEGSIPEYYDWNYPIVIDGSMFHDDTFVEFRNMNGKYYSPSSIDIRNNNSTIYIYLPRNRRLPVGVYDIIISNGKSYETQMVYGVFSVVEEGDYIPNEEYRVKDDSSTGMVKEIIGRSKDVLELSSRYTDNRYLEIDLDELMGSNTWVRSIEYPISYRDSLGELQLKSKWVNANISSLRLSNNYDERYIELRVGKVEPSMADILKKKLVGKNIKSNFIEVSGANFDFTNLTIEIPYFDSDGSRLRILRYDESNRRFEDVPYIIDLINGKVKGMSSKPGIFVIVE